MQIFRTRRPTSSSLHSYRTGEPGSDGWKYTFDQTAKHFVQVISYLRQLSLFNVIISITISSDLIGRQPYDQIILNWTLACNRIQFMIHEALKYWNNEEECDTRSWMDIDFRTTRAECLLICKEIEQLTNDGLLLQLSTKQWHRWVQSQALL